MTEQGIEQVLVDRLEGLKYTCRPDIRDRAALEQNFREKFEELNRVKLTDGEFQRLLDEIITPAVFTAARMLCERNSFNRNDDASPNYTLLNFRDWCKYCFEVVSQLRINTDNSHHRDDESPLIYGVSATQIELKTHNITPAGRWRRLSITRSTSATAMLGHMLGVAGENALHDSASFEPMYGT